MKRILMFIAMAFGLALSTAGLSSQADAASAGALAAARPAIEATTAAEPVHYRHRRHYGYRYGYRVPRVYGYYGAPRRYYKKRRHYYGYGYRPYRHYRHRHYRRW
jgi:hypothetical protein